MELSYWQGEAASFVMPKYPRVGNIAKNITSLGKFSKQKDSYAEKHTRRLFLPLENRKSLSLNTAIQLLNYSSLFHEYTLLSVQWNLTQ